MACASLVPPPEACLLGYGLGQTDAFKKNSSFMETKCFKLSVCFPLWSGLSEPSQTRKPLRPLTGNRFELPRSEVLPQLPWPRGSGGSSWTPRSFCGRFSSERLQRIEEGWTVAPAGLPACLPGQVTP